jgi:ATP-dependent Lon protease
MTGELTLTGRVLPIGGLKEKILGAIRAGIDEIIMPLDNEADLDDLQEGVRNSLTIHLVEDLDQVIKIAFKREKVGKAKKKTTKKTTKNKPRAKASPAERPASA